MKKYSLIILSLAVLFLVYLFQRISYAELLNVVLPDAIQIESANAVFIFNKTTRLILNDVACMLFIYAVFKEKIFLKASLYLFLIELFLLLPAYFLLKLNLEGTSELSSPFLSQVHRLIVNPLLMILLIVGFLYQRVAAEKPDR